MIGLLWNCRGVAKKGMATKVKDLYIEYKTDFIGLQETLRKKYTDKFFRLIDPQQQFFWHWLPSKGKSGGILCGIKKENFDIVKVEEKSFSVSVEVKDKKLGKNLNLVIVYGPANEDGRDSFLAELAETCARSRIPTLIGEDFNILSSAVRRTKISLVIDSLICLIGSSTLMS
jgi:hypothetical protein